MQCSALHCSVVFVLFLFFSPKQCFNRSIDAFFIVVNFTRLCGYFSFVRSFALSLHAHCTHDVLCQSAGNTCVHFLYKLIEPLVTIPNRGEAYIVSCTNLLLLLCVFFVSLGSVGRALRASLKVDVRSLQFN